MSNLYRKKPVVIEAVLWDGSIETTKKVLSFLGRPLQDSEMNAYNLEQFVVNLRMEGILIATLEGNMKASVGDYIIKGIKGEFYPCKPEVFLASYEPAMVEGAV